jgi:hypothetical protein
METRDIKELTDLFVKQFSPNIKEISDYIKKNNLDTKIDIVAEIADNEEPALYFHSDALNLIVQMNGRIDIDLYQFENGKHFAFYEVLSLIEQQAVAFGYEKEDVGMKDLDLDRDIL